MVEHISWLLFPAKVSCFTGFFFFFKFFFNVYLFLRQRETEHERGRVRERETQNLKQAPGSEPDAGLELTDRILACCVARVDGSLCLRLL